jgi:hypothetical protein
MSIPKRITVSCGLILTALIISSIDLHPSLHNLQIYQR